jgi:hypothetical protein
MSDRDVPATSWAVWAWQAYRDGRLVEADRIEELEAKLAQQDDLVQAAVAAALREAAKISDQWIGCEPITSGILALITPDAQAALDRVVAAERERCAKVAESVALPMSGKIAKAQAGYMRDTIAHHIRKGGE